jgi:AraC-like DNA-binding protein
MEKKSKKYLYKRIVDGKLFIDRYYLEDIDINHIAGKACFSKFHFLRLFKQTYRITPHQYLITLRIEKAKELLRNNTSITKRATYWVLKASARSISYLNGT